MKFIPEQLSGVRLQLVMFNLSLSNNIMLLQVTHLGNFEAMVLVKQICIIST